MKLRYLIPCTAALSLAFVSCENKEGSDTETETTATPTETSAEESVVTETHEKVSDEILAVYSTLADKIAAIEDDATTNEAVEFMNSLPSKIKPLVDKAESLEAPEPEQAKKIGAKAATEFKEKVGASMMEMMSNAEKIGEDNMGKINQAMESISDEMEALIERLEKLYPEPESEDESSDGM